jgi:YVTN family beta-propeller protein
MRAFVIIALLAACSDTPQPGPGPATRADHSSSIAVSPSGDAVYVVNPDADSVSIIDPHARSLAAEILLASSPAPDASGAFAPGVMPRALALSPDGATLYVTGERSGSLYTIDTASHAVQSAAVCSEPIGVAVAADGRAIYVACSQDNLVVRMSPELAITGQIAVPAEPWGLAWSPTDGSLLVTHFLGAAVTAIDPALPSVRATWTIPDTAPRGDRRLAHGQPRGLYDVAARPGSEELWVAHVMLGTDTAQPDLDFESTVFPSVSILRADGSYHDTLSIDVLAIPGTDGAFGDIVSGPHALAFTGDGALAFVVDTNSEDLLAIDATNEVEAALLRPLPGHMPEGIALAPNESVAYIDERNTGDVAIVSIARDAGGVQLAVSGAPIARYAVDPMPAQMRLGQQLFYSANSDELTITKNHWVACASCHLEGRSDAVTWRFAQGPRDTPTNAGGMLGTGFLFRTADRNRVQDYWHTINVEQGGTFDPTDQAALLDALTDYVNFGIPLPIPPTTDPALVAAGKEIFERPEVGCSGCHSGARFTDSGYGNPTLDLAGPINLHDVGTCVTTPYADVAHDDVDGHPRDACQLDTPSLSGVASSPPYLHDGSAPTLHDLLEITRGKMGDISTLSADDEAALVEYLRSL